MTGDAREQRRQLSELVDAVTALPDRQRHAIVMRELEGRSYAEIGRRLDVSDGAVRQLLSRARSSLRLRLGALAGLEPVVRLAFGGGGAMSAARVGALSGGCVLSVKLGTARSARGAQSRAVHLTGPPRGVHLPGRSPP